MKGLVAAVHKPKIDKKNVCIEPVKIFPEKLICQEIFIWNFKEPMSYSMTDQILSSLYIYGQTNRQSEL